MKKEKQHTLQQKQKTHAHTANVCTHVAAPAAATKRMITMHDDDMDVFRRLVEYEPTPEEDARIEALLKHQKKIAKLRQALAKEIADFNTLLAC